MSNDSEKEIRDLSNDFTPKNAGGIMSPVCASGTSGDDNSENGTETVVRVMTTQMTKSIELSKSWLKLKSEDWIRISRWWLTRDQR